ncbi:hypothetical protein SDC9_164864 [bioreactor metagenome]|jgi:hypothetical protein|uniref:Uncharacterized protein n=1 Tax=bioreactor metagenome TaxID=1076179 RepID=A0A645FV00_9ZZZZ
MVYLEVFYPPERHNSHTDLYIPYLLYIDVAILLKPNYTTNEQHHSLERNDLLAYYLAVIGLHALV